MVSIEEVLALLGFVPASRSGAQVRGCCPLHPGSGTGKGRTFSVNLELNSFQRFKCKAAGNQLDLWARANQQKAFEAALDLCNKLNREVPWLATGTEKRNP
jgi:hypothetical protein